MRPRLLLTINCKFVVDFFARGLHTRTAVARLPLRQLGILVYFELVCVLHYSVNSKAKIKGEKPEIRILIYITFLLSENSGHYLSRAEPFGTRDTASEFGTVPKNSGRLATYRDEIGYLIGSKFIHWLLYPCHNLRIDQLNTLVSNADVINWTSSDIRTD